MRLSYYFLSNTMDFEQSTIWQLVVENKDEYGRLVSELRDQTQGIGGRFVLSDNKRTLDFDKQVLISLSPFDADPNRKEILAGFIKRLSEESLSGTNYLETARVLSELESHFCRIASEFESEFSVDDLYALAAIRMLNTRFNTSSALDERIFDFVRMSGTYSGRALTIIVGASEFMSDERFNEMLRNLRYLQTPVLVVEHRYVSNKVPTIILDSDLCELLIFDTENLFEV